MIREQADTPPRPRPAPLWLRPLAGALERLRAGELLLTTPDGQEYLFRGHRPGPAAALHIRHPRLLPRLLLGGDLGLAEGYLRGEWDSPDPATLLELGAVNEAALAPALRPGAPARLLAALRHRLHPNSRRGSRRNIMAHYDLGNGFYRQWLDGTMTYSAARFSRPGMGLAEAQTEKYRLLLEQLAPAPGSHLLEIGCGWGGFAEHAARAGHRVTGITLSPAQLEFARERIRRAGLAERVELRLQDYRDLTGSFDHAVSIEMFEAVGEAHWSTYFRRLRAVLRPGGRAALQVITIDGAAYSSYRRNPDFIQLHVFPGGMLPSPEAFRAGAQAAGLRVAAERFDGSDYAETLARWTRRFHRAADAVRAQGFDRRFLRLWRYYLAYCEAGFRSGRIDLLRTVLERPAWPPYRGGPTHSTPRRRDTGIARNQA